MKPSKTLTVVFKTKKVMWLQNKKWKKLTTISTTSFVN